MDFDLENNLIGKNNVQPKHVFGSFGYAKMSLYDRHLSLVLLLLVLLLLVLLASVSVDSLPSNFQDGCL